MHRRPIPTQVLCDGLGRLRGQFGCGTDPPPPQAGAEGAWRATVVERYNSVKGFVKILCQDINFGAATDAQRVLGAMEDLAQLLVAKETVRVLKGYLDARKAWSGGVVAENGLRNG